MPFLFWLIGVAVTVILISLGFVSGGDPIAITLLSLAYVAAHVLGYVMAWRSFPISALGITTNPITTIANQVTTPGEYIWRAFSIGLNAALGGFAASVLWSVLLPAIGSALGLWVFVVISLAAIPAVSMNIAYQVILGYTAWIAPPSMVLNIVGLLIFIINLPFALATWASGGFAGTPLRFDFTTGCLETSGGLLLSITAPSAFAFACGNFTFLLRAPNPSAPPPTIAPGIQGRFLLTAATTPVGLSTSAHEVGHCLGYAAFGPLRIIFAILDQGLFGNSGTALTELGADSRARTTGRFQLNLWS